MEQQEGGGGEGRRTKSQPSFYNQWACPLDRSPLNIFFKKIRFLSLFLIFSLSVFFLFFLLMCANLDEFGWIRGHADLVPDPARHCETKMSE